MKLVVQPSAWYRVERRLLELVAFVLFFNVGRVPFGHTLRALTERGIGRSARGKIEV